jgi:hypothetical protein
MTNNKYMTKYQLEHLKKRVNAEIDPVIDEAKLMRKSVVAELTASAESKLAKKIALRAPLSSIKLYGSESIKDLSENPDRATPLAVNDWQAINNIFLKK